MTEDPLIIKEVPRITDVETLVSILRDCGAEAGVIFANDAKAILPYTKNVINCDIHTRKRTKRRLIAAGAEKVFSLDEILTAPVNGQRL